MRKTSQHDCVIYGERLYCCGCNSNISIRAEHIEEFIQSSCLPQDCTTAYAAGKKHTHHSHRAIIYGGVYLCIKCGATASKKLIKLARPSEKPTTHGKYNKDAYIKGNAPAGFPGWPYTKTHLRENVIVNNVQYQVDQLYRQTLRQIYVPPNRDDAVQVEEVDQNGPSDVEVEPYEGSSSSDSD